MPSATTTSACFVLCTLLATTLLFAGIWRVGEHFLFDPYYWCLVGVPGCCLLHLAPTVAIYVNECAHREEPFWSHLVYVTVVATMSWSAHAFEPIAEYHKVVRTRRGLEASAAPGWASVNCISDADPQSIDVRTDRFTYFTLADPQWRVASENHSIIKHEEGWVWAVAPIEYVGPVHGCRTKYPLFAVCVDSAFNDANCGWDGHRTGSWTYMRLMTAHGRMGDDDRKPFWDEWVPNPYDPSQKVKLHHENLFEYDSVSYEEATLMVAEKEREYDEFVVWYALAWFVLTVPPTLFACVWLITERSREAEAAKAASAESEARFLPRCHEEEPTAQQESFCDAPDGGAHVEDVYSYWVLTEASDATHAPTRLGPHASDGAASTLEPHWRPLVLGRGCPLPSRPPRTVRVPEDSGAPVRDLVSYEL